MDGFLQRAHSFANTCDLSPLVHARAAILAKASDTFEMVLTQAKEAEKRKLEAQLGAQTAAYQQLESEGMTGRDLVQDTMLKQQTLDTKHFGIRNACLTQLEKTINMRIQGEDAAKMRLMIEQKSTEIERLKEQVRSQLDDAVPALRHLKEVMENVLPAAAKEAELRKDAEDRLAKETELRKDAGERHAKELADAQTSMALKTMGIVFIIQLLSNALR